MTLPPTDEDEAETTDEEEEAEEATKEVEQAVENVDEVAEEVGQAETTDEEEEAEEATKEVEQAVENVDEVAEEGEQAETTDEKEEAEEATKEVEQAVENVDEVAEEGEQAETTDEKEEAEEATKEVEQAVENVDEVAEEVEAEDEAPGEDAEDEGADEPGAEAETAEDADAEGEEAVEEVSESVDEAEDDTVAEDTDAHAEGDDEPEGEGDDDSDEVAEEVEAEDESEVPVEDAEDEGADEPGAEAETAEDADAEGEEAVEEVSESVDEAEEDTVAEDTDAHADGDDEPEGGGDGDGEAGDDDSDEDAGEVEVAEATEEVEQAVENVDEEAAEEEAPPVDEVGDGMLLGTRRDTGEELRVPMSILARHAAMLGSTGSGKTVMAKVVLEEATINGAPSLVIDPQGDLARLVLGVDEDTLVDKGGSPARRQAYLDKAEVRIWTPLRSKGLPICIDPFEAPPAGLDPEEAIIAWDMVAAGFASLAGFGEGANAAEVRSFLYEVWTHGVRLGLDLSDFKALSKAVRDPHQAFTQLLYPEPGEAVDQGVDEDVDPSADDAWSAPDWEAIMDEHDLPDLEEMVTKGTRDSLGRKLSAFSSGVNQLLFSNGTPLDIDTFIAPVEKGKVPVNIVYMNTIQADGLKQYFLQEVARSLYDWMLTQQTSDGGINLVLFMDEVAPYLPSDPRNPPAKELVRLIFKQARKYGVAAILATQNVVDVDYKILAQANTTFIGRFSQPQDIKKVSHLLKEGGGEFGLIDELPNLGPGQFQLVAPDVDQHAIPLQCRWLYTDHGAPFTEDDVEEQTSEDQRTWAKARGARRGHKGAAIVGATGRERQAAAKRAGLTGMAAAAAGVVDDEAAFEVRLMGGLGVLKDGKDPLYVMQAVANFTTAIALACAAAFLVTGWADDTVAWGWALVGILVSTLVAFVIGLELFLPHDGQLQQRISQYAQFIQYGIGVWIWILALWNTFGATPTWAWLGALVEVTTVWVTLFIVIEAVNRFKLGRISSAETKAEGVLSKLAQGAKNLSTVITGAELKQMHASSREVMDGLRWVLDFVTLLFFGLISLVIVLAAPGTTLEQAFPGGEDTVVRPMLWLGAVYLLVFLAETWIRVRDSSTAAA